uniref:C2 domain-containing protein n=1 Tax=Hyaloperonospora arabidopsidis (strain Emoy2) TaxID=559515 RepID=M4BEA4_HYAAE
MPGTPPIDARSRQAWGEVIHRRTEARRLVQQEEQQPLERRAERHVAALVVQRLVRCFLSRTRLSTRLSAVGRPVELRVTAVTGLELLCDFRNVVSVFCNVRVLKKPFGPFMFHFSTSRCSNVESPTWDDTFFVPMLSSKCDIVTTLIGVNSTGRLRFLGQAIVPMEAGWELKTKASAPLAKWKFPVDESIVGLHRFVKGTVELAVKPISSRWPCKSGQFLQGPPIKSRSKRLFPFWSKQVSSNGLMTSPALFTPRKTPTSASPSRKVVVARWGVLTDTTFHLFDNTTAKLIVSLDLAKLQLIKSSAQPKSNSSPLFPLKLYFRGIVYVLYVSSYAQQQSWEYKINLHRRELLIP